MPWTLDDEKTYESALDLLTAIAATYSELLDRADAAGDEELERRLLAEAGRYEEVRARLTPADRAGNDRVLAEYPAVLRRLESAE